MRQANSNAKPGLWVATEEATRGGGRAMKLDTPTAILGGLALIAGAYFLTNLLPARGGFGPWNIKESGYGEMWKLNSSTGELDHCDLALNVCTRLRQNFFDQFDKEAK